MQANLKRWRERVPDLNAVIARFPIAVILMAIFTAIVIIIDRSTSNEQIGRLLVGLVISAYSCVIITLAGEGQKTSKLLPLKIGVTLGLLVLFWFSQALRLNLVMAVGCVLLLLGNAVRWRQSRDDLHVWDFTHKIWTGAIFAVVGSIIFTLGILAIQAALKSLFGLSINELIERLLLPIGLGLLAPLYWLSTVPPVDEPYDELIDNPGFVSKAVAFLGTWLLSPLTLIYAAILLAYALKILMAGALPKGEIAQLTTPFLLVGTLTWLVLEPPFIQTKALAKLFRKLWFPMSIPAAFMLAIATFVRVQAYGFTSERAALCLIVIWVLGLSAWFSFGPKNKRDIRLIPGTAAAFLFLGTIGSGWLSVSSQKNRLDIALQIAVSKTDNGFEVSDTKAAQRAKSAINYLKGQKANKQLKHAFARIGYQAKDDFSLTDIYDNLGLEGVRVPTRYNGSLNQSSLYEHGNKPLKISGFDLILGTYSHYFNQSASSSNVQMLYDRNDFKISIEKGQLEIWRNDVKITGYDLDTWAVQRIEQGSSNDFTVPILIHESGKQRIAIQPIRLQSWENGVGEAVNGHMDFYIFLNGLKL